MNIVLCSKFISNGYVKDICSLIDSTYTVYEYKEDFTTKFQHSVTPCIFIFANALDEKNNTLQLKACTELFNKCVITFLDVNETIKDLEKRAF